MVGPDAQGVVDDDHRRLHAQNAVQVLALGQPLVAVEEIVVVTLGNDSPREQRPGGIEHLRHLRGVELVAHGVQMQLEELARLQQYQGSSAHCKSTAHCRKKKEKKTKIVCVSRVLGISFLLCLKSCRNLLGPPANRKARTNCRKRTKFALLQSLGSNYFFL